jgi:hypothetical protein
MWSGVTGEPDDTGHDEADTDEAQCLAGFAEEENAEDRRTDAPMPVHTA